VCGFYYKNDNSTNSARNDLVKALGVDGLEAGPLGPKFPIINDARGNWNAQLLFVSKDSVGIVGTEGSGGNTSEPTNKVEVVLTRPLAAEETARGKLGGDHMENQVANVGDVTERSLEETVLGLFWNLPLVYLEEATVGGNLLLIESLEFGSFRCSGYALKRSLA
jgi:hypothetical protein